LVEVSKEFQKFKFEKLLSIALVPISEIKELQASGLD
jgi:hypothetical protein